MEPKMHQKDYAMQREVENTSRALSRKVDTAGWVQLSGNELRAYLCGLEDGERVIETEKSNCFSGRHGTVYHNDSASVCVLWDKHEGEDGQMGTSATGGTRRINEKPNRGIAG
jgi:hypothetical protein